MKNCIELLTGELVSPIESGQISRNEVAAISEKVLEIARAKIVDHRQPCLREFFLQCQGEIRADEAGSSGDN